MSSDPATTWILKVPGGRQADALSDLPGCALLRALILAKVGLWWAGF